MFANIDAVKKEYEEQLKVYQLAEKERDKLILQRQQLEAQLTENELVKTELKLLQPDTKVFKLIGPTLVKQNLEDSKTTVDKRLEYIAEEIKRSEKAITEVNNKVSFNKTKVENALREVQQKLAAQKA